MPFFNHRPKKYAPTSKPEAKIPIIFAHRSPSSRMQLILTEVEKSFAQEAPQASVKSLPTGEEVCPEPQPRMGSFFDIPESLKDFD